MFQGWLDGVLSISKLVITIVIHLNNHDYRNHDDLIVVTKNNHDNLFRYLTIIVQHYQQKKTVAITRVNQQGYSAKAGCSVPCSQH